MTKRSTGEQMRLGGVILITDASTAKALTIDKNYFSCVGVWLEKDSRDIKFYKI
jgi:hypothetical protein